MSPPLPEEAIAASRYLAGVVGAAHGRQMEPYPHERFRPVPLYLRDAGAAHGPYHTLIDRTIAFLRETPVEILRDSHFGY